MKKYVAIMILAFIAFINAGYLTFKYYQIQTQEVVGDAVCDINDTLSCTTVLAHPDATIFGLVPFPAVALFVYPILFGLALWGRKKQSWKQFKIIAILSGLGILFNATFIYIESFVIKVFCPLCLLCTAIIISIFILSLLGKKQGEKESKKPGLFSRFKR